LASRPMWKVLCAKSLGMDDVGVGVWMWAAGRPADGRSLGTEGLLLGLYLERDRTSPPTGNETTKISTQDRTTLLTTQPCSCT
jgi:hypothetical protein